ncbi:MAG TPA: hypothetical protein VLK56_02960 [Solirubrobacterales bacterium]|nr:hypothetical protein [Solirubrobacterales bacterium]
MPGKLQLLALPLVLAILLFAVNAANATPVGPTAAPSAFEEDFEGEEEGEGEEANCEEAEEEFEEGELSAAEVKEICAEAAARAGKKSSGSASIAPEECVLRSAHAQAALLAQDSKLKLTIGYTTYEPIAAKIEVGHGSGRIASLQRHLGRSGVVRLVENTSKNHPKQLVVSIQLPSVKSAGCPFRRLVLFPR